MSNTVYKTFKLHADQKEIVEAALNHVKDKVGTEVDTVALELICQQYMGTGISFADAKSALTAERKKSANEQEFITKVGLIIEEVLGQEAIVTVTQPSE